MAVLSQYKPVCHELTYLPEIELCEGAKDKK